MTAYNTVQPTALFDQADIMMTQSRYALIVVDSVIAAF